MIITKGETTVALYAIGYMKETWFIDKWNKMKFAFIKEENQEKYFNILLIHQNNENDIISSPETAFFDLVILGSSLFGIPNVNFHEENRWHTYKPGSSIVTTYNQTEIRPKHMGLLNIRRKDFQFEPYFLKETQRELLLKEISAKELKKMQQNTDKNDNNNDKKGEFNGFLEDELEFLLEKEILQLLKDFQSKTFDKETTKLPLLRLKVEYSGFDAIRIQRLEKKFAFKVANSGYLTIIYSKIHMLIYLF